MPASQAIAGVEKPAAFGANYATQNLEKLGLSGAIADYRRREAEAGKPAEPGNMAELKARDFVGPKQSPLQQALDESKTRREGYATDAAAAGKITAGLNTAPTPNLRGRVDLQVGAQRVRDRDLINAPRTFDWRTTPDSKYLSKADSDETKVRLNAQDDMRSVPGVSSMLDVAHDVRVQNAIAESRAEDAPAPEVNNYGGKLNVKLYGPEGYVDPKHVAKIAEMEKAKKAREEKNRINMGKGTTKQPAMDRLFGRKPTLFQGDSLAGRYYDALNK